MEFKNWLNESVDALEALKAKTEDGFSIKTKKGVFKFSEMDGKKFVMVVDDETSEHDYKAIVVAKKNDEGTLDISVSLYDGEELVGKAKAEKEEDDEVSYSKLNPTKEVFKDIKNTIEKIISDFEEVEMNESIVLSSFISGVAPLLGLAIPAIYKLAVENGYFGLGTDKSGTPAPKENDLLDKFKEMPRAEIVKLLKDEKKMDEFVDSIIAEMKKASPRLIINPRTKGEIYDKVAMNLRRVAHVEDKKDSKTSMPSIRDAAKEVLTRSVGSKHGGLYLGKSY